MTANHALKSAVRKRMEQTGEKYTTALRALQAEREATQQDVPGAGGVRATLDQDAVTRAWRELAVLTQESGDPDIRVCVAHGSVNVCRHKQGCRWADGPQDVRRALEGRRSAGVEDIRKGRRT